MSKTYYAAAEGFIEGAYRKVGDKVGTLTDRQAKYLLMDGTITAKAPEVADGKKDK